MSDHPTRPSQSEGLIVRQDSVPTSGVATPVGNVIRKTLLASSLLISMAFNDACRKEFSFEGGIVFPRLQANTTETVTIQGLVMDDKGAPLADATVFADNQTVQTDRYGLFRFEKVQMKRVGGLVTVTKDGFFDGSRSLAYDKTGTNFMRIRMLKRVLSGTVKSSTGGTVTVGDASIILPASGFKLKYAGSPYSGDVRVYAAFLPPNRIRTLEEMPGNLYGMRSDSGFAGLETLGMMTVELEGSAGEQLQLADGKEATLEVPAMTYAPAVVPLWFFDPEAGIWKEEGNAYKVGSKLVGKVRHFSSWNWDLPYPVVTIKARFVTGGGLPLQNYRVLLKRGDVTDNTKLSVMTVTDSSGRIKGPLPVNEKVTLAILSPCDEVLLSKTVGPINAETDLGEFTVNVPNTRIIEVTGTLTDCNNQNLKKGHFSMLVGDKSYRSSIDASGNFKIAFLNCDGLKEGMGSGFDIDNYREGDLFKVDFANSAVSLGAVRICGTVVQNDFIEYTVNRGSLFRIEGPKDSLKAWYSADTLIIQALSEDKKKSFNMRIKTNESIGQKPIYSFQANQYVFYETMTRNVDLTRFETAGGFIDGNLSAVMWRKDTTGVQQWIDSSRVEVLFRLKRRG